MGLKDDQRMLIDDGIKAQEECLQHAHRVEDVIRELPLSVDLYIKVHHLVADSYNILCSERYPDQKHVHECRYEQDLEQLKRMVSEYAGTKRL